MKFLSNNSLMAKMAASLLLAAVTFTSCKKENDNMPNANQAGLAIIHASPGLQDFQFNINGKASLQAPIAFGTYRPYNAINSGTYKLSVSRKGETAILSETSLPLKSNAAYSIYIADAPTKPTLVLTEDNLTAPAANQSKIRFVNMSPDAGSLDLRLAGSTTALYTNTAFKSSTAYSNIAPTDEATFEVRETGKTEVLLSLPKIKIERGKIYTIWVRGFKAATDATKLSLGVITNR